MTAQHDSLLAAARAYVEVIEADTGGDDHGRADVMLRALAVLYLAALETDGSSGAAPHLHDLPPLGRAATLAPLAPVDGYRTTRHATYDDEYGREAEVVHHSLAHDLLVLHGALARYLRALDDGIVDAGTAVRSLRFGFDTGECWGHPIAEILRALDELRRW